MSEHRDAVVIGSGAGGSVMAFELARRGLDVTVVEAGARWDPTTFEHDGSRCSCAPTSTAACRGPRTTTR